MTQDANGMLAHDEASSHLPPLPTLLGNASAAVMQLDTQGRVQLWNHASEKLFGWPGEEVLGKPPPTVPNELWEDNQAWFLRCLGGQTMSGVQLKRRRKDGTTINVHAWAWPVRNQHGTIQGVMKMFFPVGERAGVLLSSAEEALKLQTEQAKRFHNALVNLSKTDYPHIEAALRAFTTVDSLTLHVERVSIWLFNEDHTVIECVCLYQQNGNRFESGKILTARDYPHYFQSLQQSRTIAATDARHDPRTSEYRENYLEPLGITSMLDVPIRLHGKEIGIVCHEHVGAERDWTLEEQAFAAAIADFVSLAFENQEHAKAERALKESQATLLSFVESTSARMGLATLLPGNDLQVVWGNSALRTAWPGLFATNHWCSLSEGQLEPDLVQRCHAAALEALHSKRSIRFEMSDARSGQWLEIAMAPVLIPNSSNDPRVSFIIENKTEYHRTVEELARSEQLLSAVINGSPLGIQVFDQDGVLQRQNPAMEQLEKKLHVACEVKQFNILKSDHVLSHDDAEMARQALAGAVVEQSDRVITTPASHDEPLVMDTVYYPIRDLQLQQTTGFACFHRDVSERRRFEDQIQQAQRLESLGLLAGTIAHDFNGLLTAIYGFLDLAQNELPTTHMARTYLQSGLQAALRATDLTQQLLAYAGKGKREIKPFDLSVLVLEVTDLLRSVLKQHGSLNMDLSPNLPDISGDLTQIRQLIMNLITNAAESHVDDHGLVSIKTDVVTLHPADLSRCQVLANDVEPGPFVMLQVSDQGMGISPEVLQRIFDPFFTTKAKGRGLGLAAVVGIVRGHKGALHVESHPGEGTTFYTYLPISS